MKPSLNVLLLSDSRPGHFNQSKGLCAALERKFSVSLSWFELSSKSLIPGRIQRFAAGTGAFPSWMVDRMLSGEVTRCIDLIEEQPDLIVSAGGKTLPLNAAVARTLDVPNVFCGSRRNTPFTAFSAILHTNPQRRHDGRTHIGLKPTPVDPERAKQRHSPPQSAVLLIGGPTPTINYSNDEIRKTLDLAAASDLQWTIFNGPRTPVIWSEEIESLAERRSGFTFVDFHKGEVGRLAEALLQTDAAIVTADSASMVTDCVAARLPTITLLPEVADLGVDQAYYRDMEERGWLYPLSTRDASDTQLQELWGECSPMLGNHLDVLAETLLSAVPQLRKLLVQ